MAAGKGSGGVRIEVQRKAGQFMGLILVSATGTLVQTCEHEHPAPGQAVNCARDIARKKGYNIVE